ncbi:hypothetical protein PHYPO_G00134570 [Pangasianodon hypophthalmus]|uniref:Uncharacterized protein n=1 Tax=Pangasianodon hypophthalmus TaxID=310915 RepID=A0A5N5KKS1_PANHP|nr:hypothetical protein PHYPO_G00134570 [Pangasianodon hypophthalmus]
MRSRRPACWNDEGVNMAVHSSSASVVTQTTTFTIIGARLRHRRRPISRVSGQRASGRAHAEAQSALLCSLPAPGTARERGAAALQDRRASPEPEQPEAVKASQVSPGLQPRPSRARTRFLNMQRRVLKRQNTGAKNEIYSFQ